MFKTTLYAGWGNVDFNQHMRNTAFLDLSADVRLRFFESEGFSPNRFVKKNGELAAEVFTKGVWFDLKARAIAVPPAKLAEALRRLKA